MEGDFLLMKGFANKKRREEVCRMLEIMYVKHCHRTLKVGTLVEVSLLGCRPCRPGHRPRPRGDEKMQHIS